MTLYICEQCATYFAEGDSEPDGCPICQDERQYVRHGGQRFVTFEAFRETHRCELREEAGLLGIGVEPSFAIGQRALLVPAGSSNVLWDCVPLCDDDAAAEVERRGGLKAVAISHPHYYAAMVDWAERFDCQIYLHGADREHVMRPDDRIVYWEDETLDLGDDLTLIRCGGHFAGGTVLHWPGGDALLCGDIVQVIPDLRFVGFMYSYPNLIPLSVDEVQRVAEALEPYRFERIVGAWWDRVVPRDGNAVVKRSAARYARAVRGDHG